MATTYAYKNGTGNVATTFPFTFPYIKEADVKVEVLESGAWVTKTKDTHYEFTNATTLKFKSGQVPVSGTNNIKISRATDADKLTATFYPGSAIRSVDLNDNFTQNLYSTEESKETGEDAQLATDRLVAVTYDGGTTWTQTGNNTNASTDPKGVGYSITQAEAAVTTSNTANTTAASAVTTANSAVTTANSAVTTANAATTTANSAVTTANTASTNATNAVNTANAAFQRDGSATMTGNIVFEGATDDGNETTLAITDPTADRTITLPNVTGTVVTTGDTGTVALAMMAANSVDSDQYVDGSIDTAHISDYAITFNEIANDTIKEQNMADNAIVTVAIADEAVTNTKLGPDAVTSGKIGDDELNSEHYAAASIDTEHIASLNITTALIANENVTTGKIADNAVTIAKIGCEETTLTANSDAHVPTSKAVSDYVINLLNDAGGFHPILDDQKFPNANPDPNDDAGTIVSIADAGGLVVNGSGVSTTGRTLGGSTVTINGIDSSLHNTTIAAGKGMLVQTTSTLNTYDYHRLVLDEAGVASADTLITDFNERYRTSASRTADNHSSNHDGDLYFDQGTNTMYVYDGAYDAGGSWKQVTSAGEHKYLYLCPAGGSGPPTINNAIATYDLREGSNSGTVATVSVAAQLTVSVNGVLQKPNSGTSAPSEGFALVDGNTIIFGANLPTGSEVFIIQSGSATTINTPADNSVTTTKIASAAVTTAKIADDAVDGSKLANNIDIAGTLGVTGVTTLSNALVVGTQASDNDVTFYGNSVSGKCVWDASADKLDIEGNIEVSGGSTFSDHATFGSQVSFSKSGGSNLVIGEGFRFEQIVSPGNTQSILEMDYGKFEAYYQGNKKFETTSTGAAVAGTLTCTGIGTLNFADDVVANWGNTADGRIFYENSSNEFHVRTPGGTADLILGADVVKITNEDGNTDRLTINSTGVTGAGGATFAGKLESNYVGGNTIEADGTFTSGNAAFRSRCNSSSNSGIYHFYGSSSDGKVVSISTDGAATFAGNVQVAGAPSDGSAVGALASKDGFFHACRSSGTSVLWAGYTQGTSDATSLIHASGAATFKGTLNSDGLLKINSAGTISGSSNMIQAYDESANLTFNVTAAGAATFTSATINGDEYGGAETAVKIVRSSHVQMCIGSTGSGNAVIYLDADNGDFSSGQYTKLVAYNSGDLGLENWMTGGDLLLKTENSTRLTIDNDGDATFTGSVTAASFIGPGAGITDSCQWRLTSDLTGNQAPLTGWELVDTYAGGGFGSAMTESSGIFTFPSTGWWQVVFHLQCNSPDHSQNIVGMVQTTTDNSSYTTTSQAHQGIYDMSASYNSHGSVTVQALVDVTSTTNVKVRFKYTAGQGTEVAAGSGAYSYTNVIFTRLGDT